MSKLRVGHRGRTMTMALHKAGLVMACLACQASGDIQGVAFGTAAPPALVGGVAVTPLPFDERIFADMLSVPDGFGREIHFDRAMSCRQVGFGWATWSHGYTGNVYYSNGAIEATLQLPRGTKAAYLYVETNPFAFFDVTITATDGTSQISFEESVHGMAGAAGWGFFSTGLSDVVSIHILSEVNFSVGEFAISAPCPGDLDVDGFVDFSDFLSFLNYYDAADAKVDYTADGIVDFSDYLVFLNYYGNSCEEV